MSSNEEMVDIVDIEVIRPPDKIGKGKECTANKT
jgi:hypothetical protein